MTIKGMITEIDWLNDIIEAQDQAIEKIQLNIIEIVKRKGEVAGKLLQEQAKEKINGH